MTRPAPGLAAPGRSPRPAPRAQAARAGLPVPGLLVGLVVALLGVLVAALLVAVTTGQVTVARVTTGSMAPAVPVGSLVVGRPVAAAQLRVGHLLTAHVPAVGGLVTHRVVALSRQGGRTLVTTRGDANVAVDPWTTSLPDARATRVVATLPRLGAVLGRGPGGVPLLTVPLLVALLTCAGCSRLLALLREPA